MDHVTLTSLRADVESRFSDTGPRPGPAPRPGGQSPAQEEYSRCLDPGKYVIVTTRVAAWVDALVGAGLATTTPMGQRNLSPWGTVETTAMTATRPGTEPLFLHVRSEHLPGVVVAHGHPEVVLTSQPGCGCDACDDGSDELLEAIDDAIESVVLGEVLIEQGSRFSRAVTRTRGWSSSGVGLAPARVIGRWNGAPWISPGSADP